MSESLAPCVIEDNVATITLNRPEVLNAANIPLLIELKAGMQRAIDEHCRCLVITGAGRGFCAGQDLSGGSGQSQGAASLGAILGDHYYPIILALRKLPMPSIAAINGVAAGGGLALSLACDVRIVADNARLTAAFAKIGLVPDVGMAWSLPRLVGRANANRFIMRAEPISAADALAMGMVDEVVPSADFRDRVQAYAKEIAAGPTVAYALARQLMDAAETLSLDQVLGLEIAAQREAGASVDHKDAVAAFFEKRPPKFRGR